MSSAHTKAPSLHPCSQAVGAQVMQPGLTLGQSTLVVTFERVGGVWSWSVKGQNSLECNYTRPLPFWFFLVCSVLARPLCFKGNQNPERFPETSVLTGDGISSAELNEVFSWLPVWPVLLQLLKKYLLHPFFRSGVC